MNKLREYHHLRHKASQSLHSTMPQMSHTPHYTSLLT